jgi:hypothetical protein
MLGALDCGLVMFIMSMCEICESIFQSSARLIVPRGREDSRDLMASIRGSKHVNK